MQILICFFVVQKKSIKNKLFLFQSRIGQKLNIIINRVQIIPAANRSGRVLVQDQTKKVQEPNGRNETEDSNSKNGDKVRN